ncbi:uncharacterized protein VTP21DRAFT_538 [Calcarisporiella thermophila]|uniref:uncharacterized protein n=1 Tax=Calcarisporiella thermophila TaxID=911321 RepID=UPI003743A316
MYTYIIDQVEILFQRLGYKIKYETDFTSHMTGGWYLSPRWHAHEFILTNLVFFTLFFWSLSRILRPTSPVSVAFSEFTPARSLNRTDMLITVLVASSVILTATHKMLGSTLWLMFQPCHMHSMLLAALLLWPQPKKHFGVNLVLNVYLHHLWGTLLALAQPDFRGYGQFLEKENFWFEHVAILVLPFYMLYSGRFALFPLSLEFYVFAYTCLGIYHSLILEVSSIVSGININYMLAPPPGKSAYFGGHP